MAKAKTQENLWDPQTAAASWGTAKRLQTLVRTARRACSVLTEQPQNGPAAVWTGEKAQKIPWNRVGKIVRSCQNGGELTRAVRLTNTQAVQALFGFSETPQTLFVPAFGGLAPEDLQIEGTAGGFWSSLRELAEDPRTWGRQNSEDFRKSTSVNTDNSESGRIPGKKRDSKGRTGLSSNSRSAEERPAVQGLARSVRAVESGYRTMQNTWEYPVSMPEGMGALARFPIWQGGDFTDTASAKTDAGLLAAAAMGQTESGLSAAESAWQPGLLAAKPYRAMADAAISPQRESGLFWPGAAFTVWGEDAHCGSGFPLWSFPAALEDSAGKGEFSAWENAPSDIGNGTELSALREAVDRGNTTLYAPNITCLLYTSRCV